MSVISEFVVTSNRVILVWKYLQTRSTPVSRDELVRVLAANTLARGEQAAAPVPVINEAETLGLIASSGSGNARTYAVPEAIKTLAETQLPAHIESVLLRPGDTPNANFPYALAWLLTRTPAEPLPFSMRAGNYVKADLGPVEDFDVRNDAAFQNLVYWARYLGFTWLTDAGRMGTVVMPDPTIALTRHISALLEPGMSKPLAELARELGVACPVLEGGWARDKIEGLLAQDKQRQLGELSPSTSFALMRLHRRRIIELDSRSDYAEPMRLLTWPNPRVVTHIRRL